MAAGRALRALKVSASADDLARQRAVGPALASAALDSPLHATGRPASAALDALSRPCDPTGVTPAAEFAPWSRSARTAPAAVAQVPLHLEVVVAAAAAATGRAAPQLPPTSDGRSPAADASATSDPAPRMPEHGNTADMTEPTPRTPTVALSDVPLQALHRRTGDGGGHVMRAAAGVAHTSSMPDVGVKLYSDRYLTHPVPARNLSPMRVAAPTLAVDVSALSRRPQTLNPITSDAKAPPRRHLPSPTRDRHRQDACILAAADERALATTAAPVAVTPAGRPRPVLMSFDLPSSSMHVGPAGAYFATGDRPLKGQISAASATGDAGGGGSIWELGKNPRFVTAFTAGNASMGIVSGVGSGGAAHSVAIALPVGHADASRRAALAAAGAAEAATLDRQCELRRLVQISRAVCAAIARKREALARIADESASRDADSVAASGDDTTVAVNRSPLMLPSIMLTQEGRSMILQRVEAVFVAAARRAEDALRSPEAPFHGFGQDDRRSLRPDDDTGSPTSDGQQAVEDVDAHDRHRATLHIVSLLPDGPLAREPLARTGLLPAATFSSAHGSTLTASARVAASAAKLQMYDHGPAGGYSTLLLRVMGVHLFGTTEADASQEPAAAATQLRPHTAPSLQPQLELHVLDLANAMPPFAALSAADQRAEVSMALQDPQVIAEALDAGVDMRPSVIERAAAASYASGRAVASAATVSVDATSHDVDGSPRDRFTQWWGADATAPVRTAHLVRSLAMAVLDPITTATYAWRAASADPRMRAQLVADAVADPVVLAAAAASNLHLPNGSLLAGDALMSLLAHQRTITSKPAAATSVDAFVRRNTGSDEPASMFAVAGAAATFHVHPPSPHVKPPQAVRSPSPARTQILAAATSAGVRVSPSASDTVAKLAKPKPPEVDIDAAGLAIAAFAEWFECSSDPAAAEARERILVRALENASFEIARRVASAHGRKPRHPPPVVPAEAAAAVATAPAAKVSSDRRSRSPGLVRPRVQPAAATKARAAQKHAAGTAAIRNAVIECVKPPTPLMPRPDTAVSLGDCDTALSHRSDLTMSAGGRGERQLLPADGSGSAATDNVAPEPWATGTPLADVGADTAMQNAADGVDDDDGGGFGDFSHSSAARDVDDDVDEAGSPVHSLLLDVLAVRRRLRQWDPSAGSSKGAGIEATSVTGEDAMFYDDSSSDEDGVIKSRKLPSARMRRRPPSLLQGRGRRYTALAAIDVSFAEAQRCIAEAERHVRALDAGSDRIKAALWADTALSAREALDHGDDGGDSDIDQLPRDRSLSVLLDVMRGDAKLTVAGSSTDGDRTGSPAGLHVVSMVDDDDVVVPSSTGRSAAPSSVWPLHVLQAAPNAVAHGTGDVRGDLLDARAATLASAMHDLLHRRCGRAAAQAAAVRTNRLRWEALSDVERAAASDHYQQAKQELARRRREDIERAEHPGHLTVAERMKRAKHVAALAAAGGPGFKARASVIAEWRAFLAAERAHLTRVRAVVVAAACLYATATGRERDARRVSRAAAAAGMQAEDRWSRLREADDARRQAEHEQEVAFAFERFVPFFADGEASGCVDDIDDDGAPAVHRRGASSACHPGPLVHQLSRVFALSSDAGYRPAAMPTTCISFGATASGSGSGADTPAVVRLPGTFQASKLNRSATTAVLPSHCVVDGAHAGWLKQHAAVTRASGRSAVPSASVAASADNRTTSPARLVRHGSMASAAALELRERSPSILSPSLSTVKLALPLRHRLGTVSDVAITRAGRSPVKRDGSDTDGATGVAHAQPRLQAAASASSTGDTRPPGGVQAAALSGGTREGDRLIVAGSLHPSFAVGAGRTS